MENCAHLQQVLLLTREDGQSGGNRTTPKNPASAISPNQIDPIKNSFSRRKSAKIYISQRHCSKNRPKIGGEVNTMGIMDMIQSLAGQTGAAAGTDQAKVAGGFIEALTQHPEGIQGVLDAFKNNGMASHIGAWGAGQAATATPEQVQQGLGGTGLIEKTAAKVVSAALATVLPMVIQHFAPNGQATPASGMSGMAEQLLSKLKS
jgi:uncharacterized protein YidB (DUF937 family)